MPKSAKPSFRTQLPATPARAPARTTPTGGAIPADAGAPTADREGTPPFATPNRLRQIWSGTIGTSIPKSAMDSIDVWRTAHVLLKEYGAEAGLLAARRADALLDLGDPEGFAVWKRVAGAIADLERQKPTRDEHLN
jgi:hypothetical protein